MNKFNDFNLSPSILECLKNSAYHTPTPIQNLSIPLLLKENDLLGIAQTGTGKTAAFSLPLIDKFLKNKIKVKPARIRSLIVTPTRELASQIEANIKKYSKGQNLKTKTIFGGVGKQPQVMALSRGVDILIATPGRLLDLTNEGHVIYEQLEVFILDEADRMLEFGFLKDIKKIISMLPKKRQTLLFSATMPKDIRELSKSILKNPETVEVTPESTTVEKIKQTAKHIPNAEKINELAKIVKSDKVISVLVFTRTKYGADKIVKKLSRKSIEAVAIHGNKSQGARERALENFRSKKVKVLIATDIAARGIDVPHISHVVNYNIPDDPKSYVHRIGRTARAGSQGCAISLYDDTEIGKLKDIEKIIKQKIPRIK
jgi:ATP-dependent RNA helicase RhlE